MNCLYHIQVSSELWKIRKMYYYCCKAMSNQARLMLARILESRRFCSRSNQAVQLIKLSHFEHPAAPFLEDCRNVMQRGRNSQRKMGQDGTGAPSTLPEKGTIHPFHCPNTEPCPLQYSLCTFQPKKGLFSRAETGGLKSSSTAYSKALFPDTALSIQFSHAMSPACQKNDLMFGAIKIFYIIPALLHAGAEDKKHVSQWGGFRFFRSRNTTELTLYDLKQHCKGMYKQAYRK
ncbi:hypothetical protein M9H77_23117 [Catharanthus roseus]|uniref:Uncharacterized protein n=1 Tax=Catharanthus roseus TaxID=4058 RepID=A0ACC0AUJ5_CATRO|nr:hypothetical protein M9H77_23117 [Catharanthus roseus]